MGGATQVFADGESMSVVTDKRLAEVQAQYEHLRTSWIDPGQHEAIRKELNMEQHAKQSYEVCCVFFVVSSKVYKQLQQAQKSINSCNKLKSP